MQGIVQNSEYDKGLDQLKLDIQDPRFWLKFTIAVLTFSMLAFMAIWNGWWQGFDTAKLHSDLDSKTWVTLIGVYLAAVGWLISAIVTVRNSVKQHTINTLLQTRLSTTYMDKALKALKFYSEGKYDGFGPAPEKIIASSEVTGEIEYVLNYFEFLAVGIRLGDLHENVLRLSMRGIVVRFTKTSENYIDMLRTKNGPLTYDNLIWLYLRWYSLEQDKFPM